jgi:hypothetical protein
MEKRCHSPSWAQLNSVSGARARPLDVYASMRLCEKPLAPTNTHVAQSVVVSVMVGID